MGLSFTIHKRVASKVSAKLREIRQQPAHSDEKIQQYEKTDIQLSTSSSSISEIVDAQGVPSVDECKTHLRFLKVLYHLREDVSNAHETIESTSDQTDNAESMVRRKDQTWNLYTEQAAERFEVWWRSLAPKNEDGSCKQMTITQCLETNTLDSIIEKSEIWTWTEDNMLPIDVLMVLHSYMLYPRSFFEDCIRFDMIKIWQAGMPWDIIEKCISTGMYDYNASDESRKYWKTITGLDWESPQTAVSTTQVSSQDISLSKLRTSLINLRDHEIPLSGTLLEHNGEYAPDKANGYNKRGLSFADEIMSGELGERILEIISDRSSATHTAMPRDSSQDITVYQRIEKETWSAVESKIASLNDSEADIRSKSTAEQASTSKSAPIQVSGPASIKRFFAAHSQSSIFTLDLAATVRQQCLFVDIMQNLEWVYSPGLNVAITSLLHKYTLFIKIIGRHPTQVATPTNAADVAWHTHQCAPLSYYKYCLNITQSERPNGIREFIDHDNNLSKTILTGTFEWTTKAFEEMVGGQEEYSECLCWYCTTKTQMQRSIQPKRKPTPSSRSKRKGNLDQNPNDHDDDNTDNSINIPESMILERIAGKQQVKFEDDYARELRRRSRKRATITTTTTTTAGTNINSTTDQSTPSTQSSSPPPSPSQELSPQEYLKTYKWLYPNAIPILFQEQKAYKKATPDKSTLDAVREQERLVEHERTRRKGERNLKQGKKRSSVVGDRGRGRGRDEVDGGDRVDGAGNANNYANVAASASNVAATSNAL